MRRLILPCILAAILVPVAASALTLRDLVELSRAGLGDEVLLALIDVDRPVFSIDAGTLKSLKAAGVSERVIVAVVRSGRPGAAELAAMAAEPVAAPEPPEPQVIVIEHRDETPPQVREVAVPYPVFIPVATREHTRSRGADGHPATGPSKPNPPAQPVYWGWGGKRRPDAWKDK
jgi:hypothetical protein